MPQVVSVRTMPWLVSARASTRAPSAGAVKLGQPHPESNLAVLSNTTVSHAAQR